MPVKLTICGLPEALSVKVTVPDCAPLLVGAKVTETSQMALAASVAGH